MTIELDRATFRRLVQLDIIALCFSVLSVAAEYALPGRWAFSESFETLVVQQFGPDNTPTALVVGVAIALVGLACWLLASLVGLLTFRRWARFGYWASAVGVMALSFVVFGLRPMYTTALSDVVSFASTGLFGAIVLLSYARGYGAEWFALGSTVED